MQHYEIVNATRDDLPRIVDIYNSTIAGRKVTADLEPVTVESRVQWFEEHSDQHRPILLMKIDHEVIAWLSFQNFHSRAAYNSTAEVSIYISEEHRARGIGSLFLQEGIERCSSLKIVNLVGLVFGHNIPSIALLKKFNFEQWGHLPGVAIMDGIERDLLILGRRI